MLAGLHAADTGTRAMEGLPPREPALLAFRTQGPAVDGTDGGWVRGQVDLLATRFPLVAPAWLFEWVELGKETVTVWFRDLRIRLAEESSFDG